MNMTEGGHVLVKDGNEYEIKDGKRGVIVSIRPDSPYPYLVCIDRLWLNFRAKDVTKTEKKLTWFGRLSWQCRGCHERCKALTRGKDDSIRS